MDLDFSAFDPSKALDAILFCDDSEIVVTRHLVLVQVTLNFEF